MFNRKRDASNVRSLFTAIQGVKKMTQSLPFPLSKDKSFFESLTDWIGDILYDELPEKGFECRDEQIFMSFQIEQALKNKQVLFAEAGVGTGKTIAYLLPAICYARYTGKPALIACADETLIDQLVKKNGDIEKLEDALNLSIDVRLAKSRHQYLCMKRLEEAEMNVSDDWIDDISFSVPEEYYSNASMNAIPLYGVRSDYPNVSDENWNEVNYNSVMNCSVCDLRNKCGLTMHRKHYRSASDLIICSQDFLMEHLATKESRIREGQLPLLPEVSLIVLDEGHLLEYAAHKAMTYKVQSHTIINLIERLMVVGVREKTVYAMESLIEHHELFFKQLMQDIVPSNEERKKINKSKALITIGNQIIQDVEQLLEEFVFESELYVIPEYDLNMAEEYLEQYMQSLQIFISENDAVDWLEETNGEVTLVIMPRFITDVLDEKLFTNKKPIIFSSATLSVNNDFSYMAYSLGIRDYESFHVDSPFDYDEVMKIYMYEIESQKKNEKVYELLKDNEKTLILFKSKSSMMKFKNSFQGNDEFGIDYEGERELSSIIRDFQSGKITALCSYHLWEGLDLPEDYLTRVIVYDLPFPPKDPLFDAKREFAEDPYEEVDLPFMQLRIQQGIGRLIRTSKDYGDVHIFIDEKDKKGMDVIIPTLPVEPKIIK